MAKAIHKKTEHTVVGWDMSETVRLSAKLLEAADEFMIDGNPKDCDMVLIAVYPQATVDYVLKHAKDFKKGAVVVDCAGIKRLVCRGVQQAAEENGFLFVGAHPMAGIERSGFNFSSEKIFEGATMILTPYQGANIADVNKVCQFFKSIGFSRMQIATDAEHDQMIAYTSQLAHVVSSAYIKSELSPKFKGFSAGSFHDMTRVAKLNETMWTDLFLENRDYLLEELNRMIGYLQEYQQALEQGNGDRLCTLLAEGRICKEKVDAE